MWMLLLQPSWHSRCYRSILWLPWAEKLPFRDASDLLKIILANTPDSISLRFPCQWWMIDCIGPTPSLELCCQGTLIIFRCMIGKSASQEKEAFSAYWTGSETTVVLALIAVERALIVSLSWGSLGDRDRTRLRHCSLKLSSPPAEVDSFASGYWLGALACNSYS